MAQLGLASTSMLWLAVSLLSHQTTQGRAYHSPAISEPRPKKKKARPPHEALLNDCSSPRLDKKSLIWLETLMKHPNMVKSYVQHNLFLMDINCRQSWSHMRDQISLALSLHHSSLWSRGGPLSRVTSCFALASSFIWPFAPNCKLEL